MIPEILETLLVLLFMIPISSAWIFGVKCLFSPGYILESLAIRMEEDCPRGLNKPLFLCPPCMASIHGSFIYLTILSHDYGLILWIPFVVCLAGFNYFIIQFVQS